VSINVKKIEEDRLSAVQVVQIIDIFLISKR
jgi:hypothetical protein